MFSLDIYILLSSEYVGHTSKKTYFVFNAIGKRNVKKIKYALSEYPLAITN